MDDINKKELSETDICDLFITPAIKDAGWDPMRQIRREVTLTPGPVIVRGNLSSRNKKKKKFADYVLSWEPGVPVAVVEAKDNKHTVSQGMQQALGYAGILEVPSAFSSNGDAFAAHNKIPDAGEDIETQFPLDQFPPPQRLWTRYKRFRGIDDASEALVAQPYHTDSSGKEPRYYQAEAINRVIEAVARGERRVLLVMATGTGKTYTTFQIIWRLWKARAVRRVLFLVDRNILADQTLVNDFKPFGSVMAKVKHRKIDPAYEIHLALYQAITGPAAEDKIYRNVSPDFFDMIVIDECHRGSAAEDSAWREILDYFSGAIQLGMTATPKETKYVSNLTYFNPPVYTYSLKQGIADGFLAPYKVVRIDIDKDLYGWTPPRGMKDDLGQDIEHRTYNHRDMDRVLVLNKRARLVARRVMRFLNATDPFAKTIIFCEDIPHAERMRVAMVNAAGQLALDHPRYVVRITGDSNEGKAELDNFIDPESRFPVIATTSDLMTTGVDAKTCKLIVLDKTITSMTVFKQIIGRGTGGFLTCTIQHKRERYVKTQADEEILQASIHGVDKKALPHMLCVTNMILHGIDTPTRIRHDNTLGRPLRDYTNKDRVNVIVTNPPFGGMEEDGIENNFPASFRTRETADLFVTLIIHLLKDKGRAAVVLPDGFFFGEGMKTRLKEKLLTECNLHTIVRLPNGVFNPYTGIKTNLLFFTKGVPTEAVWYYEHPYPEGVKSYNKTKPMRFTEFKPEIAWWGSEADGFKTRVETEQAWKVSIDEIKARNYNLDIKNPHVAEAVNHDPDELLKKYNGQQKEIKGLRDQLKAILTEALSNGKGA